MISIDYKGLCCGCGACAQSCPKRCITMHEDIEGFLYPIVNEANCVDCGLCEKVCPFINPYDVTLPQHTFAAINPDKDIRRNSSSGGIFYLLASAVLKDGGAVFGALFNETWDVVLDYVEDISEIKKMQGSKYVQASTGDSFRKCKEILDKGQKVLYTGTPCQISGLRHFLRKEYDNLFLVDFVCHGTPSPKVWKQYINEIQVALCSICSNDSQLANRKQKFSLKSKFSLFYDEESGNYYLYSLYRDNDYMNLFLNNTTLRPSCFSCKVKGCSSHSDLTIGDYWGINEINPDFDDNLGVSSIMIHSKKGLALINSFALESIETSFEDGYKNNSSLLSSSIPNLKRDVFFTKMQKSDSICEVMGEFLKPSLKDTIKKMIKLHLNKKQSLSFNDIKNKNGFIISNVQFRNKLNGWRAYGIRIDLQKL